MSVAYVCKCVCVSTTCLWIMEKAFSVQEGTVHSQVMAVKKRMGNWQAVTGSM